MDDRRDGHLLTPCASLHVRIIQHGSTDESYPSRVYCDARNTYLYPKVRIVSPAATTCTKGSIAPVSCPRFAFCIFHFRRTGGTPEALQNAISGLGCWSDFSLRTRSEGGRNAGRSMRFRVNINRPREHKREGIVSISDAKRLPRN